MNDTAARPSFLKRFYPLAFMLILTVLFISAVTGAHLATRDIVFRNRTLFIKRAVLLAAGLTAPEDNAEAEAFYTERVRLLEDGVYEVSHPETGPAVVKQSVGAGLWGSIEAMVGFLDDGALAGVAFTDQNETPGLGARIEEDWFKDQFRGKRPPLRLVAEGTRSESPNEIDSVTGATVTSKAVRDIVNQSADGAGNGPAEEGGGPNGGR